MKENFPYKIIDVDLDSEHNVVLILREIKNGKNLKIQILLPALGSYSSCSRFYSLLQVLFPAQGSIVHALGFTSYSRFYSLLQVLIPASDSTPCFRFYFLL